MSHCEIYNVHFSKKVPVFGAWRQAPHVQRDSVGTALETAVMFEAAWGACVVTDLTDRRVWGGHGQSRHTRRSQEPGRLMCAVKDGF